MQEVTKLKRTFLLFSVVLVVAFCAVIIAVIYNTNVHIAKDQTYGLMNQIAERPHALETLEETDNTSFPYLAVFHSQTGDVIAGNTPIDAETKAHIFDWTAIALASNQAQGELAQTPYLWLKRPAPFGSVVVFANISSMLAESTHLLLISCGVAAVVCAGFILLSKWLANKATTPVEAAFTAQRQFVSDASHELKTPLTIILTNAELANSVAENEDCKRYTTNILQTAKHMKKLSEGLLDLSRTSTTDPASTINMSDVATELALSYEALSYEAGHQLTCTITPNLHATIAPQHAEQIISILLDNAAKHAEGDGPITLNLAKDRNTCICSVTNPCLPLSKDDLAHMFSRFWQADTARTQHDSYGLGLAIAKTLAEQADGSIKATYQNGFITVTLQLPIRRHHVA